MKPRAKRASARGRNEDQIISKEFDTDVRFSHESKDEEVQNDVAYAMKVLRDQIYKFHKTFLDLDEKKMQVAALRIAMASLQSEKIELQKIIDDTMGVNVRDNVLSKLKRSYERPAEEYERGIIVNDIDMDALQLLGYEEQEKLASERFSRRKANRKNISQITIELLDKIFPLQADIRKVEAKFGGATASYFSFSRWIFLQFLFTFPFVLAFTGLHIYNLLQAGHSFAEIFFSSREGFLPMFMNYSTFNSSESVAYTGCLVIASILFCINIIVKLWRDDLIAKGKKAVEGENYIRTYAKDILNCWDNTLGSRQEVEDYSGSLVQQLFLMLNDSAFAGRISHMTGYFLSFYYRKLNYICTL